VTHAFINPADPNQLFQWADFTNGIYPSTKSLMTTLET
jgi:hypothetical protein